MRSRVPARQPAQTRTACKPRAWGNGDIVRKLIKESPTALLHAHSHAMSMSATTHLPARPWTIPHIVFISCPQREPHHKQETSYTRDIICKRQHIQETQYTIDIMYKSCHMQETPYTNAIIYTRHNIQYTSDTRNIIYKRRHIHETSYAKDVR